MRLVAIMLLLGLWLPLCAAAEEPPPTIRERPDPGPGARVPGDFEAMQEHMNRMFADMDRLFEEAWGQPFGPGFPGPGRVDPFERWFRGPGAWPGPGAGPGPGGRGGAPGLPPDLGYFGGGEIDLVEEADRYRARIDVPGTRPGDVKVSVEGGMLRVTATRGPGKGDRFLRQERAFGTFTRAVPLPGPVEAGKLELDFQDGVLTVTIPKKIR